MHVIYVVFNEGVDEFFDTFGKNRLLDFLFSA